MWQGFSVKLSPEEFYVRLCGRFKCAEENPRVRGKGVSGRGEGEPKLPSRVPSKSWLVHLEDSRGHAAGPGSPSTRVSRWRGLCLSFFPLDFLFLPSSKLSPFNSISQPWILSSYFLRLTCFFVKCLPLLSKLERKCEWREYFKKANNVVD